MSEAPRSLFIVALPRSLSTQVFTLATSLLPLHPPAWADAGELLNPDRWLAIAASVRPYQRPEDGAFGWLSAFLDDAAQPRGRVYKDVTQPFVVAAHLASHTDWPVLRIRRPLADIALAMKGMGWNHPATIAPPRLDADDRLLWGLLHAWRALAGLSAVEIDYDDLLDDPGVLSDALRRLYPEQEVAPAPVWDDRFRARRDEVLARRTTDDWLELDHRATELERV